MNEMPGVEVPLILAYCPTHREFTDKCPYCETARDMRNQARHPLGTCDQYCRSMEHVVTQTRPVRGTLGKSGMLIYYPDGTTNADKPPEDDPQ